MSCEKENTLQAAKCNNLMLMLRFAILFDESLFIRGAAREVCFSRS